MLDYYSYFSSKVMIIRSTNSLYGKHYADQTDKGGLGIRGLDVQNKFLLTESISSLQTMIQWQKLHRKKTRDETVAGV